MYWLEQKFGESVFMVITRRDDIGADLRAPSAPPGSVGTASYALVSAVNADAVVIHYGSRQKVIIGVSAANGPAEPAPTSGTATKIGHIDSRSLARLTSWLWRLVSKPMMRRRNLRSLVRMCASQSSYPMIG